MLNNPHHNAIATGYHLALAAAAFPGNLFKTGIDTAYEMGSTMIPPAWSGYFNRFIGNRPNRLLADSTQPGTMGYGLTHRYDGVSGWHSHADGDSMYIPAGSRAGKYTDGTMTGYLQKTGALGKLPMIPSQVYQMKNVAELANLGMNRLYYDKYSLWNKMKDLANGSTSQFTRKAAFYNRKVILPRGPITRGQRRSYLLAMKKKAPRRKRKRSYKRV